MKNLGVRYGVLGGVTVVFYFALLYFAKKVLFLNPWLQWGSLLLYIVFMYKAALDESALADGPRDFRAVTRTPFLVFLFINLAYWLFFYAIHLGDKSLIVMELDGNIQMLQAQIQSGTGDPVRSNELRLQIAELEKLKASPAQPLGPVLAQMAQGTLGGFAIAAAIAAILKKD